MPGRSIPRHVLIVEDNPSDALLVRVMVGESLAAGEIVVATRLAEALALLEVRAFDVVLLDLSLPDSFGLDTLTTILERAPGVPVVVLTADTGSDHGRQAVAAGAQDYLNKQGIDPTALSRSISFAIERAAHARQEGERDPVDPVTGLPVEGVVEHVLQAALARSIRSGTRVAVIRFDLAGSTESDVVLDATMLRSAADRLIGRLRDGDAICHLGSGQFLVVVQGLGPDELYAVAERLLESCRKPFEISGQSLSAHPVAGIAVAEDPHDVAGLLAAAQYARDEALSAPDRCLFADALSNVAVARKREATASLLQAMEQDQFSLHYQPIVESAGGRTVALEALIRWEHPQRGTLGPGEFLALAEEKGLMVRLGRWVLARACRDLRAFHEAGHRVRVAVNLSPLEVCAVGLLETVAGTLAAHGLDGRWLEVELTENSLAEPEQTRDVLDGLKAMGVRCTVDDFGTGYSSLTYLTQFRVDAMKIDRSFVSRAIDEPQSDAIVRATIAMAHELGLQVVAEGVETAEQLALVAGHGCEFVQGYFIGRPEPAHRCMDWLEAHEVPTRLR